MTHEDLCSSGECRKLDRRFPLEGHQIAMFDQRTQRVPTEGQALADLFRLAGKTTAIDRNGQHTLIAWGISSCHVDKPVTRKGF